MNKTVSLEDAERILADASPEQCFWVNNGPIIRNLSEMANALACMKDEIFSHHVNKEKNDFGNWVRDVLKDEELANNITSVRSKEKILKKVQSRLKKLEIKTRKKRNIAA